MPFALPNLEPDQYRKLVYWVAQGHRGKLPPRSTLRSWNRSLLGDLSQRAERERAAGRALCLRASVPSELALRGSGRVAFSELLRSKTPPGQPIVPVATRRPYGDPGGPFFYRLRRSKAAWSPVASSVNSSALRLMAARALLSSDYTVSALPSYENTSRGESVSHVCGAAGSLPLSFLARGRALFHRGLHQGPGVSRSNQRSNVIEDRFWIVCSIPDSPLASNSAYINQLADYLAQLKR